MKKLAYYFSAALVSLLAWSGAHAQLAQQPLTVSSSLPPNVLFAISVEFPTAITPAYTNSYSSSTTYLGYFDPLKCYDYNVSYAGAPAAYSAATAALRYFVPVSVNTTRTCNGTHWSGNFLNWVSMAGLDEFRFAMTGGTRIIDTATSTVLQRTFQTAQGGNFGEKSISGNALVTGATPLSGGNTWYFNSSGQNVQMKFGTTSGSSSNSVYVQVQVCNATVGLESNCKAYSSTTNKPEGAIQKNSDGMRFGVLSYFNSNSIDNAVLRAKLKFTGQYTYNTSGVASTNAAQEWDPTTGIYVGNPDSADASASYGGAVTNSGVVNYLNKFGSSGQNYKTYDNVGKLYYEALAYLRNRTLDSDFYNGATAANNDAFPVITSAPDPIMAYCQKNFIFVMGDTHTWCDKRLPGGSFTGTNNAQCNAGGGGTTQLADSGSLNNGDTQLNVTTWTNNISAGLATSGFQNGASYYMGGMAYWAHINDIRPDLNASTSAKTTVSTYIVDVQESNDTGINSQYWYAAKYGGFDTGTNFSITTPAGNNPSVNNNWADYDTLYNGSGSTDGTSSSNNGIRPKNYLPAGNPQKMIDAVNSAFSKISDEAGANAATSQSSSSLQNLGGAYLFQSTYATGFWSGDLKAYLVTASSSSSSGASVSSAAWSASAWLTNTMTPANRVVLTYNDGISTYGTNAAENATLSRQGVAFKTLADLSTAQQAALNADSGGTTDSLGTNRINYLRGVRSGLELKQASPGPFRQRSSLLGDIVNSSPVYVGAPSAILFEPGYVSYAISKASRTPMVYVGANDGMLHGFNANPSDTANVGHEVMAYVPSPGVRKLSKLTDPNYSHTYFVDGSPVVADACPGTTGCTATASWKTVLIGGMNAGGQGIYALDISTPTFSSPSAGAASSTVMWEFTDGNGDADLGYTFGRPVIAKMKNGRWAAIFGNGYYNNTNDGTIGDGKPHLFIVYLSGPSGPNRTWVVGTDYFDLLPSTAPGSVTTPNGLGGPAVVDKDLDGAVDYVYAGDTMGNVWKFDVSSATPSAWTTAFSGSPLFTAKDASNNVQPITGGLTATNSIYGGFMLHFGTGSFIKTADAVSTSVQTIYGILDHNDGTRVATTFRNSSTTNSLQKQGYVFTNVTVSGSTKQVGVLSTCLVNYPGLSLTTTANPTTAADGCPTGYAVASPPRQLGFYLDLPNSGERVVADQVVVRDGVATFISLTPSGLACTGGATGLEYALDPNTGGRTGFVVFDLTGSGVFSNAQNYAPSGAPSSGYVVGVVPITGTTINTPSSYSLPASTSTLGNTPSVGTGGAVAGGCSAGIYVPGWGCVGTASSSTQSIVSCTDPSTCIREQRSLPKNRLYWRQLFTQ